MLLSKPQVDTFWSLWARVCRDRKWNDKATSESERRAFLARCGFSSLTKVDRVDGFTKVKNELLVMIGLSVQAGMEASDPLLNKARNFRHVIRTEILPCLALYEDNAEVYLTSVLADKSRWWKLDRPDRAPTLEDFDARPMFSERNGEPHESPSQLEQLLMTLNARLHEKRKAARHTLHDMKTLAGVRCTCSACCKSRMRVVNPLATAPVAVDCPF